MVASELGTPLVSVVIPFHNRLGWVGEAVESVKAQTYPNIEIILVDDGSTEDVSAGLGLKDEAIRYVRQSNKGPSAARNCGIDLAQGEFVAFLDSDDLFTPEKVARQVASMLDHPDIVMSHTSYQRMDETGNLLEVVHSGQYSGWVFPEILLGCGIATPTVMVRRSALRGNLRFNEAVRIGEDLLFWGQLACESAILGIDEPLSRVRLHGANTAFDQDAQIQSLHNLEKYGIRRSSGISAAQRRKLLATNYHNIAYLHYRNSQKWRALTCEVLACMKDPGRYVLKGARPLARFVWRYIRRLALLCVKVFIVSINIVRLVGTSGFLLVNSKDRRSQPHRCLIISPVLPRSWSSQTVIIERLLSGVDPRLYCLASINKDGECSSAGGDSKRLPSSLHVISPENQLPGSARFRWIDRLNTHYRVLQRAICIGNLIRLKKCSTVIVGTGDLIDPPATNFAARLTGAACYLHFFYDYIYQWTDPIIRKRARAFEYRIVRGASGLIAPNEFMAQEIQHRHGREAWIVRNPRAWPAKGMTSGGNLYEKGRRRGMLLYTGAICHINASTIRIVISALERIDMPSVLLHVYTAQAKEELQLLGMCGPKLVLHPHAPYEEVELVQRSADVLLVPFDFESPAAEAIRTAAPGELGDYLASGRPILAVVPTDTFVAWYLRRHDCGLVVDKADAEAVAEAVRRLLEDPDLESRLVANAAARAEEDFDPSWAQQAWLHALQLKQSRSCMSQPTAR